MLGVTVCAVSIYVRPVIIRVCACPVIACACHVHVLRVDSVCALTFIGSMLLVIGVYTSC